MLFRSQPEFTQIDVETSFMDQDQVLELAEGMLKRYFKEIVNVDIKLPLRRINYWEAMDTYGSDKPDTRYGLHIQDVSEILKKTDFASFKDAKYIKGILIPGKGKETSRKKVDLLSMEARKFNLKGVLTLKVEDGKLEGSFAKFLTPEIESELRSFLSLKEDDLFVFASSNDRRDIDFGLGALRTLFAKEMGLIKAGTYDLLWVVNFPMFDRIEGTDQYTAEHHP